MVHECQHSSLAPCFDAKSDSTAYLEDWGVLQSGKPRAQPWDLLLEHPLFPFLHVAEVARLFCKNGWGVTSLVLQTQQQFGFLYLLFEFTKRTMNEIKCESM